MPPHGLPKWKADRVLALFRYLMRSAVDGGMPDCPRVADFTNSLNPRRISYDARRPHSWRPLWSGRMLRVRLKADGRLVEVLPDGSERARPAANGRPTMMRPADGNLAANMRILEAAYARNVRGRTGLTQAVFAARIGVPVETVRNWEQGKRSPRGPARALLKLIEQAPEAAFAALGGKSR